MQIFISEKNVVFFIKDDTTPLSVLDKIVDLLLPRASNKIDKTKSQVNSISYAYPLMSDSTGKGNYHFIFLKMLFCF